MRHFLNGEFVVDRKKEAHLCKSMLNKISREDGSKFKELAHMCCSTSNMVVKTVSHRRSFPRSPTRLSFLCSEICKCWTES